MFKIFLIKKPHFTNWLVKYWQHNITMKCHFIEHGSVIFLFDTPVSIRSICPIAVAENYLVTIGSAAWLGPQRPSKPLSASPVRPRGLLGQQFMIAVQSHTDPGVWRQQVVLWSVEQQHLQRLPLHHLIVSQEACSVNTPVHSVESRGTFTVSQTTRTHRSKLR